MLTRLIKAGDTSEVLLAIALERDLGLKKLNGKVGPRGPFFCLKIIAGARGTSVVTAAWVNIQ